MSSQSNSLSLEKNKLKKDLISTYRKYKSYCYHDNYSAIQKFQITQFEHDILKDKNDSNQEEKDYNTLLDDFFDAWAEELIEEGFENNVKNEIIDNINVISLPKEVLNSKNKDNEENKDNKIISNCVKSNKYINKIHYFIDLPVKGHILGVLWILRCGYTLDDKLYKNCYGNRLNNNLLNNLKKSNETDYLPRLFKPYFKKYSSWRDNGLNSINTLLNNDQDAIMLSLDFKNYYYTSLIDFNALWKVIEPSIKSNNKNKNLEFEKKLHGFIKDVFCEYSKKFKQDYKDKFMIPLGFLPSSIIANWNLQDFDKAILEKINPFYYGRYVDDILIVMGSHERSASFKEPFIEEMTLNRFLKRYFTRDEPEPLNSIFHCNANKINLCTESNNDKNYPNWKNYHDLEMQLDKLKIYKFKHDCPKSIINNFKKRFL